MLFSSRFAPYLYAFLFPGGGVVGGLEELRKQGHLTIYQSDQCARPLPKGSLTKGPLHILAPRNRLPAYIATAATYSVPGPLLYIHATYVYK